MAKFPIGLVLRQIFDEKVLSPTDLAKRLAKSKQSVYNDFKRTDMNTLEVKKWADALGVKEDEILDRWRGRAPKIETSKIENPSSETPVINKEGGDVYLQQHLINLEEQFKVLAEQLRIKDKQMEVQLAMKDKQIDGLQRTVDVLLGKSDVSESVTRETIKLNSLDNQEVA